MLRLIQVGMGAWGIGWGRVVQRSAGVALVALVDRDRAALNAARTTLDLPATACFTTLADALDTIRSDAVLITATPRAHVPLAIDALGAGKHVLLEKPFAPTVHEAYTAVALAEQQRRVLMISQNYRFFPAPRTVAAIIRSGALGTVGSVSIDFRHDARAILPPDHPLFGMEQPLLAEMAVHHFDLMRMVLGAAPHAVQCHAFNPPWSRLAGPAAATATITFDHDLVVSYRGSWTSHAAPTHWAGIWRIECERGTIGWTSRNGTDASGDRVIVQPNGQPARAVDLPQLRQIDQIGVLHAYVRAIETNTMPECAGRDNLGTIALVQAAIDAATTGRSVPIRSLV